MINIEIINEIDDTKKFEEKINQKELMYKASKYKYDFQQYQMLRSFAESIYTGKIKTNEAEMDQSNLLQKMVKCNNKYRPRTIERKDKRRDTYEKA